MRRSITKRKGFSFDLPTAVGRLKYLSCEMTSLMSRAREIALRRARGTLLLKDTTVFTEVNLLAECYCIFVKDSFNKRGLTQISTAEDDRVVHK